MAFRQPTFQSPQRAYAPPQAEAVTSPAIVQGAPLEKSQEWVLFAPAPESSYQTETTSTGRTRRTLGLSRASAFGSLDTAARSYEYDEEASERTGHVLEDDDGELDSLDSHLHEFRAHSSVYDEVEGEASSAAHPVLPTHDGLGSFRLDRTTMHDGVQQHLYAFEQFNPRKMKRRRESFRLEHLEQDDDTHAEMERTRRIEEWRLGQSKALLEEIQKESRRRTYSLAGDQRSLLHDGDDSDAASMSPSAQRGTDGDGDREGFWSRITRRVIQDLMGIDDNLLSILFGEALPDEAQLSSTPTQSTLAQMKDMQQDSWEYRLLERVAKELGLLINQLTDHPGAFSTYVEMRTTPLPYAGLPVIQESPRMSATPNRRTSTTMTSSTPQFHPTLPPATAAIEITGSHLHGSNQDMDQDATPRATAPISTMHDRAVDFTKEEWEKQLDIKMVFRYLRSRFTSRSLSPDSSAAFHRSASTPSLQALGNTFQFPPHGGDAICTPAHLHTDQVRAARVRQHHPLVSAQNAIRKSSQISSHDTTINQVRKERKTYRVSMPGGALTGALTPGLVRRSSSSCASLRKSGSSRHYWDLGGSLGSGGASGNSGGMGAWGEV